MARKLALLVLAAFALIGAYLWISSRDAPSLPDEPIARPGGTATGSVTIARLDPTKRANHGPVLIDAGVAVPPEKKGPPPPIDAHSPLAGLKTREFSEADRERFKIPEKIKGGVVVTDLEASSPAAEASLQANDVIVRAQHNDVANMDDLARAVTDRKFTILRVYRAGQPFEIVIQKPYDPNETGN